VNIFLKKVFYLCPLPPSPMRWGPLPLLVKSKYKIQSSVFSVFRILKFLKFKIQTLKDFKFVLIPNPE